MIGKKKSTKYDGGYCFNVLPLRLVRLTGVFFSLTESGFWTVEWHVVDLGECAVRRCSMAEPCHVRCGTVVVGLLCLFFGTCPFFYDCCFLFRPRFFRVKVATERTNDHEAATPTEGVQVLLHARRDLFLGRVLLEPSRFAFFVPSSLSRDDFFT